MLCDHRRLGAWELSSSADLVNFLLPTKACSLFPSCNSEVPGNWRQSHKAATLQGSGPCVTVEEAGFSICSAPMLSALLSHDPPLRATHAFTVVVAGAQEAEVVKQKLLSLIGLFSTLV